MHNVTTSVSHLIPHKLSLFPSMEVCVNQSGEPYAYSYCLTYSLGTNINKDAALTIG